ncbi:MAG: nuclear transport factor 2 family protein [Gemmatimonadota bacterium]|nr:nuclear transport factor 2 family protein [Gemmatimonadota bacterium]
MTRRIAMALVALALLLPLPAFAQAGGADLRAEIAKMDRAWEKAYNAGDAAALTALYTKDAKVMPPGAKAVSGTSAIKALFAADVAQGVKNTLTQGDVVGFGDYALETGTFVATSAEGKHLDHGSFMTLHKKVDGAWKMHRDTWNSSMPQK